MEDDRLIKNLEETYRNCLETARRKNKDYGGKDNDPYANFRKSTVVGVSVEKGILVRMLDKISRISTLLENEAMVSDEKIIDTCDDLINYTAILKSYILEQTPKKVDSRLQYPTQTDGIEFEKL